MPRREERWHSVASATVRRFLVYLAEYQSYERHVSAITFQPATVRSAVARGFAAESGSGRYVLTPEGAQHVEWVRRRVSLV